LTRAVLQSSQGFIVFVVDPIGTGGQGDKFQKATTYKNLGILSLEMLPGSL
jgi:hypothetical protein